jgi:hypothetical protein
VVPVGVFTRAQLALFLDKETLAGILGVRLTTAAGAAEVRVLLVATLIQELVVLAVRL